MDEFPANSRLKSEPVTNKSESQEKKVEQVTVNSAVRRKPTLGKRMREAFGGDDSRTVMDYVVMDVLIPAAKDTMVDAVTQGFERLIFGEARSTTRRAAVSRYGTPTGHISYNRVGSRSSIAPRDEARPTLSRQARVNHDFDAVVIETRAEADQVLERMYDLVNSYDSVTVADFYDLVGITSEFTDNKWGWTNLHGSRVIRARDGYLLDLPKPEPVE